MPQTLSAAKELRKAKIRQIQNLAVKTVMKIRIKALNTLIQDKNKAEAKKTLYAVYQAIDKATKKGVIQKNAASRKKSRLTQQINKLS